AVLHGDAAVVDSGAFAGAGDGQVAPRRTHLRVRPADDHPVVAVGAVAAGAVQGQHARAVRADHAGGGHQDSRTAGAGGGGAAAVGCVGVGGGGGGRGAGRLGGAGPGALPRALFSMVMGGLKEAEPLRVRVMDGSPPAVLTSVFASLTITP